jgi:hypothetical protein
MKNKVDRKQTVRKLKFKTVKISNVVQTKLVGGKDIPWEFTIVAAC